MAALTRHLRVPSTLLAAGALLLTHLAPAPPAHADRLKDMANIRGVTENALIGYGLVVGLAGTGDNLQSRQTQQMMANILSRRFGTMVTPQQIRAKNVAVVMVTARLPPFARVGTRIDVVVSSASNAKSLYGGTLLPTALKGGNGQIYAWAEGPLSIGGFSASGNSGSSVTRNHPTVGHVPGGAVVAKEVGFRLRSDQPIVINLRRPDFTTASRAAAEINRATGRRIARAVDPGTVIVKVPQDLGDDLVGLVARVENVEVPVDQSARVIINEKTGTVVMGAGVRILPCAISHGALTVQISETPQVSQPAPFSPDGKTVVVPRSEVSVTEDGGEVKVIEGGPTLGDVVSGLNALGVQPRDLIAILFAMKRAGALRAEIEVQ
ncbi:MAG: flagellar basal body P-ring protein FlgI [Deltaproteobacteria bacterium]|nr:MAG: flagellar basal body P-ring protein FlgI [Deltaproteobacteria bacterium]